MCRQSMLNLEYECISLEWYYDTDNSYITLASQLSELLWWNVQWEGVNNASNNADMIGVEKWWQAVSGNKDGDCVTRPCSAQCLPQSMTASWKQSLMAMLPSHVCLSWWIQSGNNLWCCVTKTCLSQLVNISRKQSMVLCYQSMSASVMQAENNLWWYVTNPCLSRFMNTSRKQSIVLCY